MSIKKCFLLVMLLFTSGCGLSQGLTQSEGLAHYHPLILVATQNKGNILIKEGLDYLREGYFDKFLSSMNEALTFYSADKEKTANIYSYLGNAYLARNEYDKALSHFEKSLAVAGTSRNQEGIVSASVGLADCYKKIGDADRAWQILTSAGSETHGSAKGMHPLIAISMGEILVRQNKLPQALDILTNSLAEIDRFHNDKLKQSIFSSLGTTLFGLGRYEEAVANYQRALELARRNFSTSDIVDILNNIGFCKVSLKRYSDGSKSFQEGLGLLSVMDLQYPEKQMYANYGLGLLSEEQHQNYRALNYYTTAIKYTEDLRGSLSSTEFRSLFLANKISSYEHAIDILIATNGKTPPGFRLSPVSGVELTPVEAAFFYAESTKARSFIELLSKTRNDNIVDRIPYELAEKERRLLSTIRSIQSSGSGQPESQRELLKKSKRDLDELIALFREKYPDYASIRYPEPVMAANIPLRDNEVLFSYKVNPLKTYLWIIEKGKKPEVIEIAASREELIRKVGDFRSDLENPAHLDVYDPGKGLALGRLLMEQALQKISPDKNIIITPDGILNMIPFEALAVGNGGNASPYIGDKYKISYYPSASVMATIRQSRDDQKLLQPLFALGDPVYDENDIRYRQEKNDNLVLAAADTDQSHSLRLRNALTNRGFSFNRLTETRDEVIEIGSFFGYKADDVNIKLDMNASKMELMKSDLGHYRFIHFATHGLLSGDIPYIMEPSLVLSQPGNRNPEDGFLRMSEVLKLKLNADCVVLSACKTALGKEVAGEGIVGLSRAFMLAGAKSVVVSLWSVESNSTVTLMKSFYSHLKSGKTREESLRLAKQELKTQKVLTADLSRGITISGEDKKNEAITSHPFFWAPFILIGERE
jgi:CHAT domain-containing protein/Tfp pilus assembly protein PilF